MKNSGSGESIQQLPLSSASTEGKHNKRSLATTTTMICAKSIHNRDNRATSLRIIPVILKNGHKRLKLNALLDDASTQTYVNSDIAAELDLKGDLKAIRVSVLKGDCKSFQSMHVKFGLESINGDVDIKKKALTVNRVTGNMKKHAQLHSLEFPMAAKTALKSTYMEDSMDSVPEVEDGIELYNQLTGLWEKAGMRARKWLCNSLKVLAVIPVEHRGSEIDLKNGELPTVKTLGILCKAKEDSFCFHSRSPEFLAPFIIRAKVIMQDVWCTGVDWDDDLDDELKAKMRRWYGDLELSSLSVPRCLHTGKHENVPSMQLHIFNDASGKAYRAVAYARHTYIDHPVTTTNIVAVKTRVAPVVFDKMVYSTSNQYI
eukprot:gene1111-461_t